MRKWLIIACALLLPLSALAAAPSAQAAYVLYDGASGAEQRKALASINKIRMQMGIAEVRLDPSLAKAAVHHARYANFNYTIDSEGDLSAEAADKLHYTGASPAARAAAAGFDGDGRNLIETVYMKERAYDMFDMAYEVYEMSLVHDRREVMFHPAVSDIGIARVGKATVVVGAVRTDDEAPADAIVYPYDKMEEVWGGNFESVNATRLAQQGDGTDLTVYTGLREVSGLKASLTTWAGTRHIAVPLGVKRMKSEDGYVLTAQRPLRNDRTYTAEVVYESGGETVTKRWTFRTHPFPSSLYVDDMPIIYAPPLDIAEGRSFVPMRYLFELLGTSVDWNKAAQTITAVRDDLSIAMTIGSRTAYINGRAVPLDSPPYLNVYTTYVPLRFVAEALGCEVEYRPAERMVEIWTDQLNPVKEADA